MADLDSVQCVPGADGSRRGGSRWGGSVEAVVLVEQHATRPGESIRVGKPCIR